MTYCTLSRPARKPADPPPPTPERILIVVRSGGYLDVFTPECKRPGVRIHIVSEPQVHPENEALADEYLEQELPPLFRELYRDDCLRARASSRPRSLAAMHLANATAAAIAALNGLAGAPEEEITWT